MMDRIKIAVQYIIPQHFLSALMLAATRCAWRPWKNALIKFIIKQYNVDMSIAERSTADEFVHFNDFFTRSLNADARPIHTAKNSIASPVDAVVSAVGRIDSSTVYQAKGRRYNLHALLANQKDLVSHYEDGDFVTLYLSPRDYHRIHMPMTGTLTSMVYVPGCLFSVNELTTQHVDALFARNERVICHFDTEVGKMSVIMVAAIFVGGMETVWHGQITPRRQRQIKRWDYPADGEAVNLKKGAEMGRFNMGSTAIVLMQKQQVNWAQQLKTANWVAMGSKIGELNNVLET